MVLTKRIALGPLRRRAGVGARTAVAVLLFAATALLLLSCSPKQQTPPKGIVGSWHGVISVQGRRLDIVTNFEQDGKATMIFVSAGQGEADGIGKGFPLINISYRPPRVDFDLSAGSDLAHFHGRLDGERIEGSFDQAGHKGTFELERGGSSDGEKAGADGGIRVILQTSSGALHGSLLLPKGQPPFPVVLIISGEGSMDRNGNMLDLHVTNSCLELLAQDLAERGFASVRYDKRGVGASAAALKPGDHLTMGTLIDDAASWIGNLKQDPRFRGVAVLGYGEGALVGMVAAREAGAEAFVSVAGPGEPADLLLKQQLADQPAAIRAQAYQIIDSLKAGRPVSSIASNLRSLFGKQDQTFLISKLKLNPQVEIAKLTVPILILQGMNDLQMSVSQAELLHQAAPGSYMDLIRGMNHVLRDVPTNAQANLASYANPGLPVDDELVNVTSEFLRMALKVPPP